MDEFQKEKKSLVKEIKTILSRQPKWSNFEIKKLRYFVEWCEKNSQWDKVESLYSDAKRIVDKKQLNK
jgi:hypothetical protein